LEAAGAELWIIACMLGCAFYCEGIEIELSWFTSGMLSKELLLFNFYMFYIGFNELKFELFGTLPI
jgi:hypothetical protein